MFSGRVRRRMPLPSLRFLAETRLISLAARTIERRALALHDPHDLSPPAGQARQSVTLIDAVVHLIVARFIAGNSIGAVAKRRALMFNRSLQNARICV